MKTVLNDVHDLTIVTIQLKLFVAPRQVLIWSSSALSPSILVFGIDPFKRVNDIRGHDMGDQILKEVAAPIVTNMCAVDIVLRYGGEEFMIAMPEPTKAEAFQATERARNFIAGTPFFVEGQQSLSIMISAGVAEVANDEQLRAVFRRAMLHSAKLSGMVGTGLSPASVVK